MANFTPTGVTFVAQGFNQYLNNLGKANKAQQGLGSSSTGLAGKLGTLGGSIASVGLAAGAAAVSGVAALGAGLVVVGTKGVAAAANLEQSMVNIAAVMGKTKDEVGPLKDEILALSLNPKLVVTATEAAQAVELLARNGITMAEILDGAAGSVVALANATGADFGVAADVATDAMVQFGVSAENMESAIDGITGVTTNSKLDINDYALAISSTGGIAAGMGVSLQDLNTGLAGTASFFSTGRVAGTSFKTFLQRLANPTDEMNILLDELGLSLFDSEGNMRALGDVAGQLNQAFKGLTDQQKAQIATQLGGADAARTVLALAEFTTEEFNALSLEVNKTGQAFQAAATRTDSLKGRMEILKSIVQGTLIQIGDKFLPRVTKMADLFIDIANRFGPPVVDLFGQIADILGQNVNPIIDDLINIIFNLASSFSELGTGGLLSSIFDIEGLQSIGTELITQAQGLLSTLITSIISFATDQAQAIQTAFFEMIGVDSIQEAFGVMLINIPTALSAIVNAIVSFVTNQVPVILSALDEWGNAFIMWIDNAINLLSQNLGAILVAIAVWATSGDAQNQMANLGMALGENLVEGLKILFSDGAKIVGVMTKLVLALGTAAAGLAGILIVVGGQIVAGILAGIINSLGGNLQPATFSELGGILKQIGQDIITIAREIGINIIRGISQGILDTINELTTTLNQVGQIITLTVSEQLGIQSPSTVFFDIGSNIVQGLINGISALAGQVPDVLASLFGGLGSFFGGEEGEGEASVIDFTGTLEALNVLLPEAVLAFTEFFNMNMLLAQASVLVLDTSLINLANITIINLQNAIMTTISMAITIFSNFNKSIQLTDKNMKKLRDTIGKEIVNALGEAKKATENWIKALERALAVRQKLRPGAGIPGGGANVGFQTGTGPTPFTVPANARFRNDNFTIGLSPREEVLVAPRGQSIAEMVGATGRQQIINVHATINNGMDEMILVEKIKRVTSEGFING